MFKEPKVPLRTDMDKALACIAIEKSLDFVINEETRDVVLTVIKYCAAVFNPKFKEINLDTVARRNSGVYTYIEKEVNKAKRHSKKQPVSMLTDSSHITSNSC